MARVSQAIVRRHLAVGDAATSTTAIGTALEDAVVYVFEKFPGLTLIDRHARDHAGVREIDIVLRNDTKVSALGFLNWYLIVECKNLARPVGYQDVVAFKDMLRTKNVPCGILVASAGIAGEVGTNAMSAIEDAIKQGTTIVVLTRADLEACTSTEDLAQCLEERYTHLVLNGTHPDVC